MYALMTTEKLDAATAVHRSRQWLRDSATALGVSVFFEQLRSSNGMDAASRAHLSDLIAALAHHDADERLFRLAEHHSAFVYVGP